MKRAILFLMFALVFGLAACQATPEPDPVPAPDTVDEVTPTPDESDEVVSHSNEDMSTYRLEDFGLSVTLPVYYEIQEDGNAWHALWWGPQQREGTEFYDAISISFVNHGQIEGPLDEFVNAQREAVDPIAYSVSDGIEMTTMFGQTAYSYWYDGLGRAEPVFFRNVYGDVIELNGGPKDPNPEVNRYDDHYQVILDSIELHSGIKLY